MLFFHCTWAQSSSTDSSAIKKTNHSPKKAAILSAILPGAGQVYNRKAWKIPIIYAGLGGFGYMFYTQQNKYSYYRKNLIAENDENPSTINETGYSTPQLQTLKIQHRRYRDIGALALVAVYVVNIIDANVDAHLKTFDVSDDLSIQLKPSLKEYSVFGFCSLSPAITIKLNFK